MRRFIRWIAPLMALAYPLWVSADDTSVYSAKPVPPNIIWVLDNSGSMNNLPCRENPYDWSQASCFTVPWDTSSPRDMNLKAMTISGRAVQMCLSTAVQALGYAPATLYPDPDPDFGGAGPQSNFGGTAATADDVYVGTVHNPMTYTDTSPTAYCSTTRFPNCEQRSRCIYGLETYGYFFEAPNCMGSGDPKGICPAATASQNYKRSCAHTPGTKQKPATTCTAETQCGCTDGDSDAYDICANRFDGTRVCHECQPWDGNCGSYPNECQSNGLGVGLCTRMSLDDWGWWSGAAALTGNFLNFYPQKYVVARRVMREVLTDGTVGTLVRQRMAFMIYDSDSSGGKLARGMNPPCNQLCFDDTCNSNFFSNRTATLNEMDKIEFETSTPLGETLDDIACVFKDGQSGGGLNSCTTTGFNASNSSAYNSGGFPNTGSTCLACQKNFAIIITDGIPTNDWDAADLELSGATGATDVEGYTVPEVAAFAFNHDLNPNATGTQNLITYAISFGATDPTNPALCAGVLARAAAAGDGECVAARDKAQLKAAVLSVLQQIDDRVRAFTAPAVQASRGEGESNANLAVFKADQRGPFWQGHMYSLDLWDEALRGNSTKGSSTEANEILVLDQRGERVTFDNEGNLLSRPFWDAQLCLSGDFSNGQPALQPEDIFNMSISSCYRSPDGTATNRRKIYTQLTTTWTTTPNAPDEFVPANAATLKTKLGITGTNSATKLINFYRGYDMLDLLGRNTVSPLVERNLSTFGKSSGWWKLGDIFHSAPTLVATGEQNGLFKSSATTTGSYEKWFADNKLRIRQIVVGANDGMIHSFNAGVATVGDNPATTVVEDSTTNVYYTSGTGEELWAFIPPHQLSKVGSMLNCGTDDTTTKCTVNTAHSYFVDGSPQVREVFTGTGSNAATCTILNDPTKSTLWKTVAIFGDRDGGTQFTALDITDPSGPKYLWEFPGTSIIGAGAKQRAEGAANSWSDTEPSPPPIFPVRFDVDGVAGGASYLRWVTVLPGGFDRDHTAGRGLYMLDAYTGELLWKFEYNGSGENQYMKYSFAAPVAGVRSPTSFGCGPYIDTLVAVDTGGQVWKFDLSSVGIVTSSALASWTGQRVFVTATATATTAAYAGNPTSGAMTGSNYPYRPMFHIPAITRDSQGNTWAMIGTGDRDMLTAPTTHPSGVTFTSDVTKMICNTSPYEGRTYLNRIYGIKLNRVVSTRPNNEDDLANVTTSGTGNEGIVGTAADPAKAGWFLILRTAEKVNNPAEVFFGVSYFTTYQPTGSCDPAASSTNSCEVPSGVGRLYALDYKLGTPAVNFSSTDSGASFGTTTFAAGLGSGTLSSADTSKSLGAGMPTAPKVSAGMGGGRGSAALLISTSQDPTPQGVGAKSPKTLVQRVFETLIPKRLHQLLRSWGSDH